MSLYVHPCPNWFANSGESPADAYSFGRPNGFGAVAREQQATRERVAIFDQTSFAKFQMIGRDVECADRLGANAESQPHAIPRDHIGDLARRIIDCVSR